jgi:hypothetical protein
MDLSLLKIYEAEDAASLPVKEVRILMDHYNIQMREE